MSGRRPGGQWSLLSTHGLVLVQLARDGDQRLEQVAAMAGITTRNLRFVVLDLVAAGLVSVHREGRVNRYVVDRAAAVDRMARDRVAGDLVSVFC